MNDASQTFTSRLRLAAIIAIDGNECLVFETSLAEIPVNSVRNRKNKEEREKMSSMHVPGQEMDEGLEEMWTESTQGISSIDPGTFNGIDFRLELVKRISLRSIHFLRLSFYRYLLSF